MADISQSGAYKKFAKPEKRAPLQKLVSDAWRRIWLFERLLCLLILLLLPFLLMVVYEAFTVSFEMNAQAAQIAQVLRRIKERAHELNTNGIFEARPSSAGSLSSYQIGYEDSRMGVKQVLLPKGFNLVGQVRFDAQGVPNRACILRIRHGLSHKDIVINPQGNIAIP